MENTLARQSPFAATLTMLLIIAAAYTRFALNPYPNEVITAQSAPLGEWLSLFTSSHRVWAVTIAGLLTAAAGVIAGRIGTGFNFYPHHCVLSMPLYAIAACGIFIGGEPLAPALAALLTAVAIYCLGSGYMRDESLEMMFYAGMCTGLLPMLYAPCLLMLPMALMAVIIFSISLREIFVMVCGMLLPPAAICYGVWAFGGDFTAPAMQVWQAAVSDSASLPLDSSSIAAMVLAALTALNILSSVAIFFGNRYSMAVKPRSILIFITVICSLSLLMIIMPSATSGVFTPAAIPLAIIMPLLFLHIRQAVGFILYAAMLVALLLHLIVY